MRSSVFVLALLGGCGFRSSVVPDVGEELPVDAVLPPSDGCTTFSTQFDTCTLMFGGDLSLSGMVTYDTVTNELVVDGVMMPVQHQKLTIGGSPIDAIYAHDVKLAGNAKLRATGTLPFAIVASGRVTLENGASIDVGAGGAGAQVACANGPTSGENDAGGGGGGGGGGYGADGGNGGGGNSDHGLFGRNSRGGARGRAVGARPPGPKGGCPGTRGGNGDAAGGAGGAGGGALYIVAADRIELGNGAAITAGGGGGSGGLMNGDAGGGGGGSGGMLVFEAPRISGQQGAVVANGGGGGEGSDSAKAGNRGSDGSLLTTHTNGGAANASDGADGGLGGSQESVPGGSVTTVLRGGGGGGGGGVGFIHIMSPEVQLGTVSPAAN